MSTVLLVEDDVSILRYLAESLSIYRSDLEILTATDGQKALDVLAAQAVDIVVTDLNMPVMDGFALLAHMRKHYPKIPVIVQTALTVPEVNQRLDSRGSFRLLQKPILYKELANEIRDTLAQASEGHITGISLFSFLQLMQWEHKTVVLEIRSQDKLAHLYFIGGDLVNATYDKLEGEEAAYKILSWDEVDINITTVQKPDRRTIQRPLQNILMEASRLKDERQHRSEKEAPPAEKTGSELAHENQEAGASKDRSDELSWYKEKSVSNLDEEAISKIREKIMANVKDTLDAALKIEGAIATALVDYKSGMTLGTAGTGLNLEVAAAGNTEVVRAKMKVMRALGLKDQIEDILITLGVQYHLLRILPGQGLFIYLALERESANLAMARYKLNDLAKSITV